MFYHGITIENLGQSSRALEPSLVDPVYGRRRPALLWAEVTAGTGRMEKPRCLPPQQRQKLQFQTYSIA